LIFLCQNCDEYESRKIFVKNNNPKTCSTGIKYEFGIQVPKGIKNAINLDKKNGNNLWEEAIKTELKQPTNYETFIVRDSGEDIPKGYQKIPYHKVFNVKYDLRHKARLVAGSHWTENEKENIIQALGEGLHLGQEFVQLYVERI
jgi:hypothetical protein